MSRSHWIAIGVGVVVLLWLVGDVNVNATVTEGMPTVKQNGTLVPQQDAGPTITYGTYVTPTFVD